MLKQHSFHYKFKLENRKKSQGLGQVNRGIGNNCNLFGSQESDVWAGRLVVMVEKLIVVLPLLWTNSLSQPLQTLTVKLTTDSLTIAMNFCYSFQCSACQWSSRMLIIIKRAFCIPSLKHLYYKKVLLWLMTLSPKTSCSL